MKKYDNLYLNSEDILREYNNLISFINDNYDKITCPDYSKTLDYILSGETYDKQIENYVYRIRKNWNSIDSEFDIEVEDTDYSLKNIIEDIKNNYNLDEFQDKLIYDCLDYYEVSVEEYKE